MRRPCWICFCLACNIFGRLTATNSGRCRLQFKPKRCHFAKKKKTDRKVLWGVFLILGAAEISLDLPLRIDCWDQISPCGHSVGSSIVDATARQSGPLTRTFLQVQRGWMMKWSARKPHPHLQCNTQLCLWSGVSPSRHKARDSEIANLASLLVILSPKISGLDPCGGLLTILMV